MPKLYAHALIRALTRVGEDGLEQVLERFFSFLRTRGELHLIPKIAAVVRAEASRASAREEAQVRVPTQESVSTLSQDIDAAADTLGISDMPRTIVIDPTLVSGFVVSAKGAQYDTSGKTALLKLYQSLLA